VPAIFGDHMVIQQGPRAVLWGWAEPGEQVTVTGSWPGAHWQVKADEKGNWLVRFDSPPAGGPYTITLTAGNTVRLEDVLVGEVWICSGQSNMAWPVRAAQDAEKEIAAADYPQIRLFTVGRKVAEQPQADCQGNWQVCNSQSVADFSAVGYFFGRELHTNLSVPVGLINASWGGTPAEAWTPREALEKNPEFAPILERYDRAVASYPETLKRYKQRLAQWQEIARKARAQGKAVPRRPSAPFGPDHPHSPAGLFNGMIRPLIPLAIRGVIWYQGEANTGRAYQYRYLFPAMIQAWRDAWQQGQFPLLFVQIAPYRGYAEGLCPELQEAQLLTLRSVPNTGMVVTTDIGNIEDIHPRNKQDVGKRLAMWAFVKAYGQARICSGPLYRSMQVEGNKIRLFFDHTAGALVAHDGPLREFTIAGADRKFVPAQAAIEGQSVIVWSKQVPQPVAVRFAWRNTAEPNLFNKVGLPASPFRTDDWPGVTFNKR